MNLDILTPKGQATLPDVAKVISTIEKRWRVQVIKTPEDQPAAIDLCLAKDGILKSIIEVKCRTHTLEQIQAWGNSWLITNEKIKQGAELSKLLRVSFIGVLYIIPNNLIYYWKITSETGAYLFDFEVRETETQMTINGGRIIRENAYLSLDHGKILKNISK